MRKLAPPLAGGGEHARHGIEFRLGMVADGAAMGADKGKKVVQGSALHSDPLLLRDLAAPGGQFLGLRIDEAKGNHRHLAFAESESYRHRVVLRL